MNMLFVTTETGDFGVDLPHIQTETESPHHTTTPRGVAKHTGEFRC